MKLSATEIGLGSIAGVIGAVNGVVISSFLGTIDNFAIHLTLVSSLTAAAVIAGINYGKQVKDQDAYKQRK